MCHPVNSYLMRARVTRLILFRPSHLFFYVSLFPQKLTLLQGGFRHAKTVRQLDGGGRRERRGVADREIDFPVVSSLPLSGLPYMTSAVGGGRGSPKNRQKEQSQLIFDSDKGGVKKSENFVDVIYGSPLSRHRASFDICRSKPYLVKGCRFLEVNCNAAIIGLYNFRGGLSFSLALQF